MNMDHFCHMCICDKYFHRKVWESLLKAFLQPSLLVSIFYFAKFFLKPEYLINNIARLEWHYYGAANIK